ncbi:MAG TPA: glycosyltransferase family A protein [Candidatus Bathyarchaeia archaeon]|nr:glycosyltransferase family A protein [Candidatus Bathyarchaeia archaeon]
MMAKVDVVMLTRNSERWLNECLESVYENVPVNRLIVIDGHSTDKTLEILGKFSEAYGNVKIITQNGSRGEARARGIREVTTEWFMFVDSDVVLCKNWFEKARRYAASDVGAVWGVDIPGDVANKFAVFMFKWMETRVFNIRGGCHDILVRRDCIKEIKIPRQLHTLEDAYIKDWITAQNYKVVISYDSWCRHYKTMSSLFSKESILPAFHELKNMKLVRERLLFAWFFGFGWFLQEIGFNGKRTNNVKTQSRVSHVKT